MRARAFIMVMKCLRSIPRKWFKRARCLPRAWSNWGGRRSQRRIRDSSRLTRAKSCLQTRRTKTWHRTDHWPNTTTLVARRKDKMWYSHQGTEVIQSSPHNPELLFTCFRRLSKYNPVSLPTLFPQMVDWHAAIKVLSGNIFQGRSRLLCGNLPLQSVQRI
jgi:hypothetical protein